MALYEIEHRCGHRSERQIYGTNVRRRREHIAEQFAMQLCAACQRVEREKAEAVVSARAAEIAAYDGLPALTGSPKQVAWAEILRADKRAEATVMLGQFAACDPPLREQDRLVALVDAELAHPEARWWIDHRNEHGRDLVRRIARPIVEAEQAAKEQS